ncbi:MAG: helix-turn-helix domain-containing protein [Methyloligellaceae bacterium]
MKWYQRTQQKLEDLGWTGAELSRRAGIEIKTIYKYLDGVVENPRGNVLSRISKALGVTEQWLRYGADEPNVSFSTQENIDPTYVQVPIIDGNTLSLLVKGDIEYSTVLLQSKLMPFMKKDNYSNELVSISIDDDKNYPDLARGDLVIIDKNQEPEHGKFAVAISGGKNIVAMYTLVTRNRAPSDALHFTHDGIPDIYIDDIDCDGVCRVIAITKHH